MSNEEIPAWVITNSYVRAHAQQLESIVNGRYSSHALAAKGAAHVLARIQDAWLYMKKRLMQDEAIPIEARHRLRRQLNSDAKAAAEAVYDGQIYHADAWRKQHQPPPKTRSTAEELSYDRHWRKLERLINSGISIGDVARTASREELAVLQEEWPSIIAAKDHGNPDLLKADTMMMADTINKRLREVGTPEEVARLDVLEEIDAGAYRGEVAAKHLIYHIEQDSNDSLPLPGWDGELVNRPVEQPAV